MLIDSPSANDRQQSDYRRTLLNQPHIAPLTTYVARLRALYPNDVVPDFDPAGGGINAEVLILLEKPSAVAGKGSGLISPHNPDDTARFLWAFMQEAGLSRDRCVHWNVIPSWNGTRKIIPEEAARGAEHLAELLTLLPNLHTVVLMGQKAKHAGRYWHADGMRVLTTVHPGRLAKISPYPHVREGWSTIPNVLRQAAARP